MIGEPKSSRRTLLGRVIFRQWNRNTKSSTSFLLSSIRPDHASKTVDNALNKCWLIHFNTSVGSWASDICAQIPTDVSLVFYCEVFGEFFCKFISAFFLQGKYEAIVHMNNDHNFLSKEQTWVNESLLKPHGFQSLGEVVKPDNDTFHLNCFEHMQLTHSFFYFAQMHV